MCRKIFENIVFILRTHKYTVKLQAQFLLYTQIAVLKHTFLWNSTHNSLHLAQFSWRNTLVFTRNTQVNCPTMHTDSSHEQTPVTVLQLVVRALAKQTRGCSIVFFTLTVYSKFFSCLVCRPLYVQLCVSWDVHCVLCVFVGKMKYICYHVFVCPEYKTIFSNILQHTYVLFVVTLNKQCIMMNGE